MQLQEAMLARGRDNNFNAVRMAAALAVLVSHSVALATGRPELEPFRASLGITLGSLAVVVFFIVSGFLVSMSLESRGGLVRFGVARALRIYPGLIVAVGLTMFVVGPMLTANIGQYATDPSLRTYSLNTVMVFGLKDQLADLFLTNPYPRAVNGSLWSIRYELVMYALLAASWMLLRRSTKTYRVAIALLAVGGALAYAVYVGRWHETESKAKFLWLTPMFFIGVLAAQFRSRIPISSVGAGIALAILVGAGLLGGQAFYAAYPWCIAYLTLYVVYGLPVFRPALRADWSYGVYIYAWLVQQIVVHLVPGISPTGLTAAALAVTLPLAICSWHFIEKPSLNHIDWVSDRIRSATRPLRLSR